MHHHRSSTCSNHGLHFTGLSYIRHQFRRAHPLVEVAGILLAALAAVAGAEASPTSVPDADSIPISHANKTGHHKGDPFYLLVEVAGIEPASDNLRPSDLHA